MRTFITILVALALSSAASMAAEKASSKKEAKQAPACAALVFRPLAGGGSDGEQDSDDQADKKAHGGAPRCDDRFR